MALQPIRYYLKMHPRPVPQLSWKVCLYFLYFFFTLRICTLIVGSCREGRRLAADQQTRRSTLE
ncbi:hypothetical protein CPB83DRAFT_855224 [Crepidotus variabilis]|uniref:Uncharacterized protein n=1 Tax=Crepidotus variabilis TaxID=179855 RepID=A0A9P6EFY8_9AGAR|nr:hypothetical protein CPB83DRAFT_855224 [Crepidotus variabilis]